MEVFSRHLLHSKPATHGNFVLCVQFQIKAALYHYIPASEREEHRARLCNCISTHVQHFWGQTPYVLRPSVLLRSGPDPTGCTVGSRYFMVPAHESERCHYLGKVQTTMDFLKIPRNFHNMIAFRFRFIYFKRFLSERRDRGCNFLQLFEPARFGSTNHCAVGRSLSKCMCSCKSGPDGELFI